MQTAKKLLSLILCVLMCCSFASFSAFAENDTEFNAEAVATADSSVTSEVTVDDISSDEFEETENISENVELTSYGEVELTATGLSGAGTSNSPYLIRTESDLLELSKSTDASFLSAYFQLQNDITLTTDNWSPIGINTSTPFKGTFDGNGHKINNVSIPENSYSYAGLFGVVTGTIKNLGVSSDIAGCSTAGALAGYVNEGTIEYCYSSGAVSSTSGNTGGLIGYIRNATVHDCYSVATSTNTDGSVGGLVGHMRSYDVCTIRDCYATGTVTGSSSNSGGIVGSKDGSGSNNILGCYYNSSTTKQSDTGKGFSITSSKMKTQDTFTAWDFDYVWAIDGSTNNGYPYLQLPITETKEDIELEGSGNEVDPYIITNETELIALARGELINSFTAYYQLANDITVNSDYWTPIGGNGRDYFSGTFDGNGHTISGIKLSQAAFEYSGLFGIVSGTVKNLGVDVKISGTGTAGALAGYVYEGTVEYCYSSGAVSGTSGYTGGLIGYIRNATVHDCYSVATSTNTDGSVGGLVGHMRSYDVCTIRDCYATGTVTGSSSNSGGIVGNKDGSGSNNVLGCYYDNYSDSSSDKGTLVSTEAMKTQSTFTGWDFNTIWALSTTKNNGYPYLQNVSTEIQAIAVTGITLDKSTLSVPVGRTAAIKANITPANATNKNVTWTSLNPGVATVNNGSVTGIAEGTAVIVALTEDGSFTANCTVTVTAPVAAAYPYEITALSLETEAGEALTSAPTGSNFIVNVELMEIQERSERDYLFVAVYDTDGSLLRMNYIKSDFVPNQTYNLGINIQAQTKPIGKIKAFVWDGFNAMDPLAETIELQ